MRFHVPIKNILGLNYYRYELTTTNYNPTIDNNITITCKVTNVFNSPVPDKVLTLYDNGVSVGEATTDNTGIATWTVTLNDWDWHHFSCNGATLDLQATGMKQVAQKTNSVITYTLYADESKRNCVITVVSSSNFNIANGEQYTITGLIPSKYAPKHNLYAFMSRSRTVSFYCWTGGSGGLYNSNTTTATGISISGQISYNY